MALYLLQRRLDPMVWMFVASIVHRHKLGETRDH